MEHFDIGKDDSVLCITSAGCNALHYAIAGQPKRIHCVDMNPCQGHILELKLACIAALSYDEFWALFGEGKHADFRTLLDTKISPYLSSHAYQFWRLNTAAFDRNFYFRGYSGHALRLGKAAFTIGRVNKDVKAVCNATSIEEQQRLWNRRLRGTIINRPLIRWFLSNPAFLWNALGVPVNQMNCFLNEGVSVEQYAIDTLDAIPGRGLFSTENYWYRLCLMGNYSKESCPLYLKQASFKLLKEDACRRLDSFRLHTDSIVNVLRGLEDASLTRAVVSRARRGAASSADALRSRRWTTWTGMTPCPPRSRHRRSSRRATTPTRASATWTARSSSWRAALRPAAPSSSAPPAGARGTCSASSCSASRRARSTCARRASRLTASTCTPRAGSAGACRRGRAARSRPFVPALFPASTSPSPLRSAAACDAIDVL
jgi:hypothetical protein